MRMLVEVQGVLGIEKFTIPPIGELETIKEESKSLEESLQTNENEKENQNENEESTEVSGAGK